MGDQFWLPEAQVERLMPYFAKSCGKPGVDDRRVQSGIIFIQRNGLMWSEGLARHRFNGQPDCAGDRDAYPGGAGFGLKRYGSATIMEDKFEYDPVKSASNQDKRGIDFAEAQRLWTFTLGNSRHRF